MNSINRSNSKRNKAIYDHSMKISDLYDVEDRNQFRNQLVINSKEDLTNKTILRGSILNSNYKSGFRIHTTDIIEVRDYDVTAILEPAISIIIMLAGQISFELNGIETILSAEEGPQGYFISRTEKAEWTRHIKKGNLIRKVVVTMDHDFITQDLDIDLPADQWASLIKDATPKTWEVGSRIQTIAERLIRPTEENPMVKNLLQQTAAMEIITEAFQHILSKKDDVTTSSDEISKALRIKNYVDQHIEEHMNLDQVASALGLSVNSMQRYFKSEFDQPLMGYIRERKLFIAHEAMERDNMPIAQAAYLAGYNSAANFSTAYKKKFGFSPSRLRSS